MTRRVGFGVAGAVVVAVLLVVGIVLLARGGAGGGSSSGSDALPAGAAGTAAGGADAVPAPGAAASGAPTTGTNGDDLARPGPVAQRDVVRSATLAVTVPDPSSAADRAGALAAAAGGRVDQDTRGRAAHVVLRVPADRLDATLTQLTALGTTTARQVQGDDVTGRTADLGARVTALQTSVDRLRTLLSTSGSLADLLTVETQLTQRQADLESLQAQQQALADQVALATVTVDLTPPAAAAAAARATGPTGFGGALAGGWHGLTVVVRYLLAGLGYTLPFLLLVAAGAAGALGVRRHHRRAETP